MSIEESCDLWGKKLITKMENGSQQKKKYVKFLRMLKERTDSNLDAIIAVCGPRGMGKSSLSIESALILRQLGMSFDFNDIVFGQDALEKAIPKIASTRGRVYVFDEMIDLSYSRNAMSTLNKSIAQFITKVRKMNNIIFLNIPRFKTLDPAIRNDIVHFWIEVFWRSPDTVQHSERVALAALFTKDRDPTTNDPWDLDLPKDKKRMAFTPQQQLRIMKRMRSYRACLSFHPLPKVIENEYENRSRSYIGVAGQDFLNALAAKRKPKKADELEDELTGGPGPKTRTIYKRKSAASSSLPGAGQVRQDGGAPHNQDNISSP